MKASAISTRYALILGAIALICTTILVGVFLLTRGTINDVVEKQQRSLLLEVVPQKNFDNDFLATCKIIDLPEAPFLNKIYVAKKAGDLTAYAIQATAPDGYSGNIVSLIGITPDGTILGVRVLEHQETPGLGDKIEIRISDWITQFTGILFNKETESSWKVKKDGGQFDQFTGATITPRAVVNNVRQSAKWAVTKLKQHPEIINSFVNCG
ncbi:electron transport complex subunit RsxG [Otariodibacter sp.]|uniref:electron transport complex subunit RsxG n=1 Tax=Otariodibacter sp. TaxID=3030919 RepID=UPI002631D6A8|nr:electron transport complex subunit RsxG [Otariodibacter sp.]